MMRARPTLYSLPFLLLTLPLFGALETSSIPRSPSAHFVTEGVFEGGKAARANLEGMRIAAHADFERWVVDFSDTKRRKTGAIAPRFQVRYARAEGTKPPRFILTFRGIEQQFLDRASLAKLVKRSHFVDEVIVYPPIEEGDIAVEMNLRGPVSFEAHQPIEREGRLVLDLRAPPPPASEP